MTIEHEYGTSRKIAGVSLKLEKIDDTEVKFTIYDRSGPTQFANVELFNILTIRGKDNSYIEIQLHAIGNKMAKYEVYGGKV